MLRSKLPTTPTALQPRVVDARKALITRQEKQKVYFDRNAKPLGTLTPGDPVQIQNGSRWEPAVVMAADPNLRSYIVRKGDKQYRRNRKHLLKTKDSQTLPPPSPPREPREEKEEEMPQTEGQSILTPPTASREWSCHHETTEIQGLCNDCTNLAREMQVLRTLHVKVKCW